MTDHETLANELETLSAQNERLADRVADLEARQTHHNSAADTDSHKPNDRLRAENEASARKTIVSKAE